LSIVLAGAISLVQYMYFKGIAESDRKIQVIAAETDIKSGERIDESTTTKVIPQSAYVKDMYLQGEKVSGYAKVDISEGSYILKNMVSRYRTPVVKKGMRRVTISVNLASSLAGKIKPGDYVDVGFVAKGQGEQEAKIIAQRVQVYEVVNKTGEQIGQKKDKKENQYNSESRIPAAVTLIVTPEQAVNLKRSEIKGSLFLLGY